MSKKKPTPSVSKKDRAKLEARARQLEAEINRREKKAAKKALAKSDAILAAEKAKAKRKAKKKPAKAEPIAKKKIDRSKVKKAKARDVGPIGVDPTMVITATPEAAIAVEIETPEEVRERAKPLDGEALKAALDADTAKGKARRDETDAEIKARLEAKRAARAASDAALAGMQADVAAGKKARAAKPSAEEIAVEKTAEAVEALKSAVEAVETEHGREFVAGESVATGPDYDFAKPSEAPKADFETNGNGQYIVKRPSDGKLVGYTRVTSYIAGIEDRSGIEKWKARVLLEGVAAAEETGDAVTARVRDLTHNRDVAIKRARKADRKGELKTGELATCVEGAWRDFKKALDSLADEVFEIGGGREKAAKGTDLHALFELHDREGMQSVADLATLGQITPADLADVEAYADLVSRRGIRFVDIERVVVNDAVPAPTPTKPDRVVGVAGRLDRTAYVKLPGETRARKRVVDIKTGSLEYSAGEISRQLASYAASKGYDLDTHEREDMKLDQRFGIVIHLPAGSAAPTLYSVDLAKGRKGLRIVADMRAFRNEGKTALAPIDFSAPAE